MRMVNFIAHLLCEVGGSFNIKLISSAEIHIKYKNWLEVRKRGYVRIGEDMRGRYCSIFQL